MRRLAFELLRVVWVLIIHFHGLSASPTCLLRFQRHNHWLHILLPFLPVPLDEARDVIRFGLRILKVDVSGLGGASVRIPIGGDSPRFSAGLQHWVGHDADRHVDTFALATLEKAIMLQVDLETVGHLENLTHPRGTQVVEVFF